MISGNIGKKVNSDHTQFKGGLRQNLRLGDEVLREFNREFGRVKSYTYINTKMNYHLNDDRYVPIVPKLKRVLSKYEKGVIASRNLIDYYSEYCSSLSDGVKRIKQVLKSNPFANCGEQAYIIKDALCKKGENAQRVHLTILDKKGFEEFGLKQKIKAENLKKWYTKEAISNRILTFFGMGPNPENPKWDSKDVVFGHDVVVFGLKENADLTNLKTWGNRAVIVDSWTGFALKAKEGLNYINDFFKFDSSKHLTVFEKGNFEG